MALTTCSNLFYGFREAICIARSRLPAGNKRVSDIYDSWAKQLRRDANLPVAAKWYDDSMY